MSTLTKIANLLAMAERTDNPHEAEAFFAKAQQLATFASVDLAMARAAHQRREAREKPISRTIQIGIPRARINRHLVQLFIGIGAANDIRFDVAHNSTYVIAFGMPSDIDVVEVMFGSISTQMVAMCNDWLRAGEWRSDTYWSSGIKAGFRVPVRKAHTAHTARGAFYAAFIQRISQRIADARDDVVKQRSEEQSSAGGQILSTAVVLADKTAEIKDFHRRTSQARGTWSGYSGAGANGTGGAASKAGRSAASRATIGAQGHLGAGAGQLMD